MRKFANKQKSTQQAKSKGIVKTRRSFLGQSRELSSILHLQRMIGNQALQQLMQSRTEDLEAGPSSKTSTGFAHFSRIPIHAQGYSNMQSKLKIAAPADKYEQDAERIVERVMSMPESKHQRVSGQGAGYPKSQFLQIGQKHGYSPTLLSQVGSAAAPPLVHKVLQSPGRPLDAATRVEMESRFGNYFGGVTMHRNVQGHEPARVVNGAPKDSHEQEVKEKARHHIPSDSTSKQVDFSSVRIHTDSRAASSAQAIAALAYNAGNRVVFDAGQYAPGSAAGKRLLAHELTHMLQQGNEIRRYRKKGAFNFGKLDDATLKEDSFDANTDKETKPWIKQITVEFGSLKTDSDGNEYSTGIASVQYYDNPVKLPDFSFTVAGGSRTLGRTDSGTFTVHRIEGVGYNSGAFSGSPGVDFDPSNREGPRNRYSKDLTANMSFAVFYNKGEALHAGPLDFSSHGCVHVDWTDLATIQQLNYHSVIGLTKVKVRYLSRKEQEERRKAAQVERERWFHIFGQ